MRYYRWIQQNKDMHPLRDPDLIEKITSAELLDSINQYMLPVSYST